ncbi:signal recognition particle subunit [Xylographa parallela]|nr:signal recognition particle subunit [Xylographa parallela]
MSLNPRIEEVPSSSSSTSDPSDMDPMDYMRPSTPPSRIHHLSPATAPHPAPLASSHPFPAAAAAQLQPHFRAPTSAPQPPTLDKARYKDWQCLYPVYFDAGRSRAEGRRVARALAVPNPLAREIADAAGGLGLQVVLEVGKTHPKDWANPGRVKVGLKSVGAGGVKNKHHLYILISRHLQAHPTTAESPFRAGMRIAGLPLPEGPLPPPAKPRGWKMGDVLPLHSPAVSGGGVSENMFKDMMQEMGGGALPGMVGEGGPVGGSGGGAEGKAKKVKRKVIRA